MPLQRKTRDIIEAAVSRKENFRRGNVWGQWMGNDTFYSTSIAELPRDFAKILVEHNKDTDLFVLYSYQTPMAWFRLGDVDSRGNNKWYYVDQHYSVSTTQHQAAYRMALKGENVVTLSLEYGDSVTPHVVETEKEFY